MSQGAADQKAEFKWKWASDFSILLYLDAPPSESTTEEILKGFFNLSQDPQVIENLHPAYCSVLVDLVESVEFVDVMHQGGEPAKPMDPACHREFDSSIDSKGPTKILTRLKELLTVSTSLPTPRLIEIPVVYDGIDLDEVSRLTELCVQDIIQLHSSAIYTVAFLGFSPGFPYLLGLPEKLWCPRKTTPRIRIPQGSVAIAGSQAGVYPTATPGGWQILGTTQEPLFTIDQDPPTQLRPGDRVRFVPVTIDESNTLTDHHRAEAVKDDFAGKIRILRGAEFVSLQGPEKLGLTHLGVSPGGAADPLASSLAKQILGNSSDSFCLEICGPEVVIQFLKSTWFTVTGAPYRITLDQQNIAMWTSLPVSAGQLLRFSASGVNLRVYLSVYGGFGSSKEPTDSVGDLLNELPNNPPKFRRVKKEFTRQYESSFQLLRVTPGLQLDWFAPESIDTFYSESFGVSWDTNRQGIRLIGTSLELKDDCKKEEMVSEGISNGSIQVSSGGSPMILFCEQRTTGGYPKIANVIRADLFKLGQLYPGQSVRFKQVSIEEAWTIYREFKINLKNTIEDI